ncbi:MAG: methyltransferase domain-containing protein [Acidimicrobiales bacterium]
MTTSENETFQLSTEAAEFYEAKFVPAIFGQWAPQLLDFAGVATGHDLLDVACGTGVVARTAKRSAKADASIVGVDLNDAMLAVAARAEPTIDWRQGDAGALPVADDSFDAAVCQMAFMFFADPVAVLREMRRATRPGGTVAALVPAALDDQPAYRRFMKLAVDELGLEAQPLLSAYWACGDLDAFAGNFTAAGLHRLETATRTGTAHFDSPEDFVTTEICGSPLGDTTGPEAISRLGRAVATDMPEWHHADGTYRVPLVCHLVLGHA